MNFYECISRLNSISHQYDIALSAFDLYKKEREAVLSAVIQKKKAFFLEYIEAIKKQKAEQNETFSEPEVKEYYDLPVGMNEGMQSYAGKEADQLKTAIRQNSLILTLSTFEIFLNDLLRHILAHKPNLLSSNRRIEIGRLISIGADKIILEEVEIQVYSIDRKNIFDRADYFKNHLNLSWSNDSSDVKMVDRLNGIRNTIVHRDTGLRVNEEDLKMALGLCKKIVSQLMMGCIRHYKDIIAPLILQKKAGET